VNLKLEEKGGKLDIGYWFDPAEWVSWRARVDQPGVYKVSAIIAAADGDGEFVIGIGGEKVPARVSKTDGWDKFSTVDIGLVEIKQAGEFAASVRAKDAASWKAINLNSLQLTPTSSGR
jgi:hypothetical protein